MSLTNQYNTKILCLQITEKDEYILTHALDAVTHPAISTATFKAARDIDAGSVHVTVMSTNLTLINIWRHEEITL